MKHSVAQYSFFRKLNILFIVGPSEANKGETLILKNSVIAVLICLSWVAYEVCLFNERIIIFNILKILHFWKVKKICSVLERFTVLTFFQIWNEYFTKKMNLSLGPQNYVWLFCLIVLVSKNFNIVLLNSIICPLFAHDIPLENFIFCIKFLNVLCL